MSESKRKILVLVEGSRTDARLMEKLLTIYNIDAKYEIVSYGTNIYTLYGEMFAENDPSMVDLLQVLKAREFDPYKKAINVVVRRVMKYINGSDRKQITLLPDCIDDLVGQDNPVRVIDAFADSLDMEKAGFKRCVPNETGRPSYDPRDLLKLYVYGYFNRIRSSRKLMLECGRNIELFFLLNRLTPDVRTISDFRKDNAKALRNVFRAFVKLCMKLGLYQKTLLAVDGSKFRAVNSKDNTFNVEILEKKLKRVDEHISEYLSQMDKEDETEPDSPTPEQIRGAILDLSERKEKYRKYLAELMENDETQILLTDPEAHRMHTSEHPFGTVKWYHGAHYLPCKGKDHN